MSPAPRDVSELYEQYHHYITSCIHRLGGRYLTRDDIDDLQQQIFLRVLTNKSIERYDAERGAFTTYLFWIVRSAIDAAFQHRRLDHLWDAYPNPDRVSEEPSPERQWLLDDVLDRFETTLTNMPRRSRRGPALLPDGRRRTCNTGLIFRLRVEGYTASEISKLLDMKIGVVFWHLQRIRDAARRRMLPMLRAA